MGDIIVYVRTAIERTAGPGLAVLALAGAIAAFVKRAFWPSRPAGPAAHFLRLEHALLRQSHLPARMPYAYSFYNTRYGWPPSAAGLFAADPCRSGPPKRAERRRPGRRRGDGLLGHPSQPPNWVVWEESRVNSEGRRAWTHRPPPTWLRATATVPVSSHRWADLTGIFREMGVPIRETFSE